MRSLRNFLIPQNRFTLGYFKSLHEKIHSEKKGVQMTPSMVVETLREMAEILIWGDQHDRPELFEYFLEKDILSLFVKLLDQGTKSIKIQVVQTLSILFQNLSQRHSLYHLLSLRHLNNMIQHSFDFCDDELLAYYISFLKVISVKLDKITVQFFFDEQNRDFPLYCEAVKFFKHSEAMVRIAVRTITLNVYKIDDDNIRNFILDRSAAPFFTNLTWFIHSQLFELNEVLLDESDSYKVVDQLHDLLDEHLDHFYYINDIFSLKIPDFSIVLSDRLLEHLMYPLVNSLSQQPSSKSLDPSLCLLVLAQSFFVFTELPCVTNKLAIVLLHPNPIDSLVPNRVLPAFIHARFGPNDDEDNLSFRDYLAREIPGRIRSLLLKCAANEPVSSGSLESPGPLGTGAGASSLPSKWLQKEFFSDVPGDMKGLPYPNRFRKLFLDFLTSSKQNEILCASLCLLALTHNKVVEKIVLNDVGLLPQRVLHANQLLHGLMVTGSPFSSNHGNVRAPSWTRYPSSVPPLKIDDSQSKKETPIQVPNPKPLLGKSMLSKHSPVVHRDISTPVLKSLYGTPIDMSESPLLADDHYEGVDELMSSLSIVRPKSTPQLETNEDFQISRNDPSLSPDYCTEVIDALLTVLRRSRLLPVITQICSKLLLDLVYNKATKQNLSSRHYLVLQDTVQQSLDRVKKHQKEYPDRFKSMLISARESIKPLRVSTLVSGLPFLLSTPGFMFRLPRQEEIPIYDIIIFLILRPMVCQLLKKEFGREIE